MTWISRNRPRFVMLKNTAKKIRNSAWVWQVTSIELFVETLPVKYGNVIWLTRDVNICDRKWFKRQDLLLCYGALREQDLNRYLFWISGEPIVINFCPFDDSHNIEYLEIPPFRTNNNSGYHYFKIIVVFGQKMSWFDRFRSKLGSNLALIS